MAEAPSPFTTHLIGDLLVVRLQGVLTAAEQHLVRSLPGEKGRDLVKQVRNQLIETARPMLGAMVEVVSETAKIVSLHHDVSTVSGDEVVLFTLSDSPFLRRRSEKQ